jgi:hypothetical protein
MHKVNSSFGCQIDKNNTELQYTMIKNLIDLSKIKYLTTGINLKTPKFLIFFC